MSDEQRTEQWFLDRSGKFTGSRFIDLMKRNKKTGAPLKAWHDLVWKVVAERLSGTYEDGVTAAALQWGTDVEPYASDDYEVLTGNIVIKSGLIVHPDYPFAAASPDGLIASDGGLEMKCPKNMSIHLARFISGMEDDHLPQVQGAMWVTKREWWDFYSYDPRMPKKQRGFRQTVQRDDEYISRLESSVIEAEAKAQEYMRDILEKTA